MYFFLVIKSRRCKWFYCKWPWWNRTWCNWLWSWCFWCYGLLVSLWCPDSSLWAQYAFLSDMPGCIFYLKLFLYTFTLIYFFIIIWLIVGSHFCILFIVILCCICFIAKLGSLCFCYKILPLKLLGKFIS